MIIEGPNCMSSPWLMQDNQLSSSSWLDIIETRSKLIFYLFLELWPIFLSPTITLGKSQGSFDVMSWQKKTYVGKSSDS